MFRIRGSDFYFIVTLYSIVTLYNIVTNQCIDTKTDKAQRLLHRP